MFDIQQGRGHLGSSRRLSVPRSLIGHGPISAGELGVDKFNGFGSTLLANTTNGIAVIQRTASRRFICSSRRDERGYGAPTTAGLQSMRLWPVNVTKSDRSRRAGFRHRHTTEFEISSEAGSPTCARRSRSDDGDPEEVLRRPASWFEEVSARGLARMEAMPAAKVEDP